jgi:hypothetical protein
MGWDSITVFILALLIFEVIAYLIFRKGDRQKLQAVETANSSQDKKEGF